MKINDSIENIDTSVCENWPVYFKEMLHTSNIIKNIGVITLWSKKDIYIEKLRAENINTIGQLYSREEGLSALIRNLLANKHITDVVMLGTDLNKCGPALKGLFEHGIDKTGKVICEIDAKLDENIPREAVEILRSNVKLHDLRHIKDYEIINEYIKNISYKHAYGEYELFENPEVKIPQTFPSDNNVFKVSGKNIKNVWIDILKIINKFGYIKKSQYGEDQKEIISMVSVITDEDPENPQWTDFFPFSKEELEFYYPQVTSAKGFEGLEYTYGQRLFDHDGIDQIESFLEELSCENYSRRAVAVTWDVKKDCGSQKAPCLNLVQCLVEDNKLYMTCFFRSNDMYGAWPRNAFALRKLQKNISDKLNLKMGNLILISNSAHIYERNFTKVALMLEVYKKPISWDNDPFGTLIIRLSGENILVRHLDKDGKLLDEFMAKTAMLAYKKISDEMKISSISHAMDIGCELQKAEIALNQGIEYVQDRPLKFN